jgi:hypothetical protein
MASALQKQLAAIAASSTHQLDLKAQKSAHGKSLLFEPKVAASQSFENVYLLCYEGYRDLCALDSRFVQFSKSLFSEQSKVEDRTQMSKEENKKLNAVLEAFITLVGSKLLLKPAQKAVEWLVRRFRCVHLDAAGGEQSANMRQGARVQHRMPHIDLPPVPQHAPIPRPPLHPPKPAAILATVPPSIHPVAYEPAATDHRIHSR